MGRGVGVDYVALKIFFVYSFISFIISVLFCLQIVLKTF